MRPNKDFVNVGYFFHSLGATAQVCQRNLSVSFIHLTCYLYDGSSRGFLTVLDGLVRVLPYEQICVREALFSRQRKKGRKTPKRTGPLGCTCSRATVY